MDVLTLTYTDSDIEVESFHSDNEASKMIKIAVNTELSSKTSTNSANDKGKRIYRAAIDSIKRLDIILKEKKAYRSAFTQEAVGLQNRLKEYCEKLMFLDPHLYGDKTLEVLWRKVFYSIISIAKNNKRRVHCHSCVYSAFRTHMSAATGFYHHLLLTLQSKYSLKLDAIVDFHHLVLPKDKKADLIGEDGREWAIKACHQCLIYLGDIARYQDMFDGGGGAVVAQRYYYQALTLCPNIGMPCNQLGVLHSSKYYSFHAAYYYIRCIVSEVSFEGTKHNLQRLFDRNRRHYQEMDGKNVRSHTGDQLRINNTRRLFMRIMDLFNIFFNTNHMLSPQYIQVSCQSTLQDFNLCMFYIQPSSFCDSNWLKPTSITPDIVYKLAVASMAAVHYQQKCGCAQVTAAIAFFLALASHVTNHVVCHLQQSIESSQHPTVLPRVDNELEEVLEQALGGSEEQSTGILKTPHFDHHTQAKKWKKQKARRRRRQLLVDESSGSESDVGESSNEGSDLSEGDNLSVSSSDDDFIDCSDHASDSDLDNNLSVPHTRGTNPTESAQNLHDMQKIWCDEGVGDNLVMFSSELFSSSAAASFLGSGKVLMKSGNRELADADAEDKFSAEIEEKLANFVIETDTEVVLTDTEAPSESDYDTTCHTSPTANESYPSHENIIEILRTEPLLPVVKVITDWLRCHVQIIKTCAQSSESLWSRLAMLLNLIPSEDIIIDSTHLNLPSNIQSHLREASEGRWAQQYPLSEDINLRCFTPLSSVHEHIRFDTQSRAAMTDDNELAIRLVCIRQFGYVTSNMPELDFSYKADELLFIGPIQSVGPLHDVAKQSAQEQMTVNETCKNRLMRDMAQLRLQREVDELQGEVACTELVTFPPYMVMDSWCLCEELGLVKQLSHTAQCVIIIPLSVIDTLDMTKKDSVGVRNAIRWLESEFKKGNRYVRDQKTSERYSINPRKQLKLKNRKAWEMVMTLDCASYLNEQTSQLCATNMVIVLVNKDLSEWSSIPDVVNALNAANNQGVKVEKIKSFHNRWQERWKQTN